MSLAMHCDSCDTWARGALTRGFLKVNWDGRKLHFCGWDCLLRYGAGQTPHTTWETR